MPSRRAPLRFALLFLAYFGVMMGAFEATRGTAIEAFAVEGLFLMPTSSIINTATPAEAVRVEGRALRSPRVNLRIIRGCEGVETVLMLVAAVLAFPATWRRRFTGVLVGGSLAYGLSLARILLLYYGLRYSHATYAAVHGLIAPLLPIAFIGLYFSAWSANDGRRSVAADTAP
jgi:exosortase family protein XrtM